jgi:hypothetical protein
VILVHSFSRFFRDQFQLEFYVRRLAKNGVRLVSITQELGDDPMSNMIRQIMALFDEYQSKENAKHTLRAMKENARQGFWNGALPPIGYRIVEAAEQRGHRTKKALENPGRDRAAVPPRSTMLRAWANALGETAVTSTPWAPRIVFLTNATGSVVRAFTASAAPSRLASCSFDSSMSTARTLSPMALAYWTAICPKPPIP